MKSASHSGLIIALLSITLLSSVVLNGIFFLQGEEYYLQLNETRLDPLGLSYYPSHISQQKLISPIETTIVFFGDSRAANWPPPKLPQFQFVNRGIGAQTSAQTLQRFDYHIKPLAPQVIIVQIGINDLKTIPLFPSQKDAIIANCKANIREIVEKSVDIGAQVILTTIFPIGKIPLERRLFWSPDVALAVDEVNSYIFTLESQHVIIFDAYSILVDHGITRDKYAQDFLHLNMTGYAALNNELVHILETLN